MYAFCNGLPFSLGKVWCTQRSRTRVKKKKKKKEELQTSQEKPCIHRRHGGDEENEVVGT